MLIHLRKQATIEPLSAIGARTMARAQGSGGDPGRRRGSAGSGGAVREFGGPENDPVNRLSDKRADRLHVEAPLDGARPQPHPAPAANRDGEGNDPVDRFPVEGRPRRRDRS